MKNCDVTVCILTYNANYQELLKTINSILYQKNVTCEIVISDDGSEENYFNRLEKYLEGNGFKNYILIENKTNEGTVQNAVRAIEHSRGTYIKLISPGDLLYGDVLKKWIELLKVSKAELSFSDAVYYDVFDGDLHVISVKAHPQKISAYKRGGNILRKNMILNTDLCVGCATLLRRDVALSYLNKIKDKVKYLEDCIYVLMLYDKKTTIYFEETAVLYKYGSGISTCENGHESPKLTKDWLNVFDVFYQYVGNNWFDKKFLRVLKRRDSRQRESRREKVLRYILNPEEIGIRIKEKWKLKIRYTPVVYKRDFIKYIHKSTKDMQYRVTKIEDKN